MGVAYSRCRAVARDDLPSICNQISPEDRADVPLPILCLGQNFASV